MIHIKRMEIILIYIGTDLKSKKKKVETKIIIGSFAVNL